MTKLHYCFYRRFVCYGTALLAAVSQMTFILGADSKVPALQSRILAKAADGLPVLMPLHASDEQINELSRPTKYINPFLMIDRDSADRDSSGHILYYRCEIDYGDTLVAQSKNYNFATGKFEPGPSLNEVSHQFLLKFSNYGIFTVRFNPYAKPLSGRVLGNPVKPEEAYGIQTKGDGRPGVNSIEGRLQIAHCENVILRSKPDAGQLHPLRACFKIVQVGEMV